MTTLQLIASCLVSIAVLLYFINSDLDKKPTKDEKLEMEAKRKEICEVYPSNISERGILCDAEGSFPENMVAYLVAEGLTLYVVRNNDMQTILEIPFKDIVEYRSIKIERWYETSIKSMPSGVIVSPLLPAFCIKYNAPENQIKTIVFFYESDKSLHLYNKIKYTSPYHYYLKCMNDKN